MGGYAAQFHDDGFAPIHRACWGHGENATATVLVFLEERTAPCLLAFGILAHPCAHPCPPIRSIHCPAPGRPTVKPEQASTKRAGRTGDASVVLRSAGRSVACRVAYLERCEWAETHPHARVLGVLTPAHFRPPLLLHV